MDQTLLERVNPVFNTAKMTVYQLAATGNTDAAEIAKKLEYISSAGLRVLLKLTKSVGEVSIVNVSPEVYEIFDVTGFTSILNVKKALREISVDGCEVIGAGGAGHEGAISSYSSMDYFNPQRGYCFFATATEEIREVWRRCCSVSFCLINTLSVIDKLLTAKHPNRK